MALCFCVVVNVSRALASATDGRRVAGSRDRAVGENDPSKGLEAATFDSHGVVAAVHGEGGAGVVGCNSSGAVVTARRRIHVMLLDLPVLSIEGIAN